MEMSNSLTPCPDCGVLPGQPHLARCDIARCSICGRQYLACGCASHDSQSAYWTGEWPGAIECRRKGWWSRMVPGEGWQPCAEDADGAGEDLNRLAFFKVNGFDGLYEAHEA